MYIYLFCVNFNLNKYPIWNGYISEGLDHYILFKKAKISLGSLNNILNKGSLFSAEKTRELKSSMGSSGVSFIITSDPTGS